MVRLLVFLGILLVLSWPGGQRTSIAKTKKIFIGVDGLSREEFDHARTHGLFSQLNFVKTHIAPFPSISDYSWNVMVQAKKVHGYKGRIRTFEAAHFDRERNELVNDPREYFRRLGEEHHYFTGAFRHWLNPYVESLLYIPTEELPRLELRQLLTSIKEDPRDLVTVMVASSDALAHTRPDGNRFLVELDKFISEIHSHYQSLEKEVEIILASDHGQASRFSPGTKPFKLQPVSLKPYLKMIGLKDARKIETKQDVVLPVMALANYGAAYFANEDSRERFLQKIRKEKWFSLGLYRKEMSPERMKLHVVNQDGEAELTVLKEDHFKYYYVALKGNPLHIKEQFQSRWLTDPEARTASLNTPFPDAFYRIGFSAFEEEAEFPDLLITLNDEYYLAGNLDSWTSMYQTHGSLGRRSSSGILASTHGVKGEEELRTNEILSAVGISPDEMFASTEDRMPEMAGRIPTGAGNWDNRRIFALMNRAVQDSCYVFEEKSFEAMMKMARQLLGEKTQAFKSEKWKEAFNLSDVARLVDLLIKNGSMEKMKSDPGFQKIQARLADAGERSSQRKPSSEKKFALADYSAQADALKKLAMKSHSSVFFLEKAFQLPEVPFLVDERLSPRDVLRPDKMFAEIFKERTLLEEVYPEKFPLHWKPQPSPENITLVYLPGIYNSLFDDEIFRSGLDHLKNKWGVRIISPQTFSTCSSSVNADIILDHLIKDMKIQQELGRPQPAYFLLGYSKGGVDALHALAKNPIFASEHIHGLLTIASPLKGTPILNKADLPQEIVGLLGAENAPAICQSKESAGSSITPAAAQAFLRKNKSSLVGLTRYYSLSFVSEPKSSHLFMRATKGLAQFGEPNDGVVPLSSSKFPEEFGAVDLGIVKADHLAGIVASHFPQKAFLESVLFSLLNADAFSPVKHLSLDESRAHIRNPRLQVPESQREAILPPPNELGYHEDLRLNLRKLDSFIGGKKVIPLTPNSHPEGFGFTYDHASSVDFRNEFQLSFEDSAPADADDHPASGWETVIKDNQVWAKLSSSDSSIRLTTYSWRFLAADYPELSLEIQVNDDVEGANVLYGGTGKDDSAFQLWLTFRMVNEGHQRDYLSPEEKMLTIGYYFGDAIEGIPQEVNHIYKNYYSDKDFILARLPVAYQKLIGIGKDMMGRPILSRHNLLEDIRAAYPEIDALKAEIVAITIQHDSNDTHGNSEALFRSLHFRPKAD